MSDERTHDELVDSLAAHLRGSVGGPVYREIRLGPVGSPVADVLSMAPSYAHPRITVYEVKRTRADALSDIGSGKWTSYLKYAQLVVFAAPTGVLRREDVPPAVGLRLLTADGRWVAMKKGQPEPWKPPPFDFWLKLLLDGHKSDPVTLDRERKVQEEYARARAVRTRLGDRVARVLSAEESVEIAEAEATRRVRLVRERADREVESILRVTADTRAQVESQWTALREVLDLPPTANEYEVRAAVRRLRLELSADTQVKRARSAIDSAAHSLRSEAERLFGLVSDLGNPT